jgi:hypothetical protein
VKVAVDRRGIESAFTGCTIFRFSVQIVEEVWKDEGFMFHTYEESCQLASDDLQFDVSEEVIASIIMVDN